MHNDPILGQPARELIQVGIQVFDHLSAHGVCALPPLAPVRQRCEGRNSAIHAPLGVCIQRRLQGFVGDRLADLSSEFSGGHNLLTWHL